MYLFYTSSRQKNRRMQSERKRKWKESKKKLSEIVCFATANSTICLHSNDWTFTLCRFISNFRCRRWRCYNAILPCWNVCTVHCTIYNVQCACFYCFFFWQKLFFSSFFVPFLNGCHRVVNIFYYVWNEKH